MKFKILLLTIALTCFSCNNDNDGNNIPECLQTIIDDAEDSDTVTIISKIDRYLFNEQEVFLLIPIIAIVDFPHSAISVVDCELICSFGGFMGEDTCSPDFFENAEFIEVVWERP